MKSSPLSSNGFISLSSCVYLYSPEFPPTISNPNGTSTDPSLILLFTWGNAPPKAIVKYTTEYQQLYPAARILLFLTTFNDLFLPDSGKQQDKALAPALRFLQQEISTSSNRPRILVHLFSNAGSYRFRELARLYRDQRLDVDSAVTTTTGTILNLLPAQLIVFDSAPGHPTFQRRMVGTQTQLPQQVVLYLLGSAIVFLMLCLVDVFELATGKVPVLNQVWTDLNAGTGDEQVVTQKAKRLYIFSKTDALVDWQDVTSHAASAEAIGCAVQTEEFVGSKHVAHVMADGQRYWGLIRKAWMDTV